MHLRGMDQNTPKQWWIAAGYAQFAQEGPEALKVEPLAKKVGVSKTSFYHFFSDMGAFKTALLEHHVAQSTIIGEKEKNCKNIDPELIAILLEHPLDLLFNRQLRVHQDVPEYAETLRESDQRVNDFFMLLWLRELNLNMSVQQLEGMFQLAIQHFYLQLTPENMNESWLRAYFIQLRKIALQMTP